MERTPSGSKRRPIYSRVLFLGLLIVTGCYAPPKLPSGMAPPSLPAFALSTACPESSKIKHVDPEPVIYRAVSTDEEDTRGPFSPTLTKREIPDSDWENPTTEVLPSESSLPPMQLGGPAPLPNYALNPVVELLTKEGTPQTRQDAFQTLGLVGLSGMVPLLHRAGNGSGASRNWHRMGDAAEDLLQPDDQMASRRLNRAPFTFGLEWKY